jgi:hypothetical protein
MKASDYSGVPLNIFCHREYHRIGKQEFERLHGIDFDLIVEGLTTEWWSRKAA